jgi:hypothetical protein
MFNILIKKFYKSKPAAAAGVFSKEKKTSVLSFQRDF